MEVRQLRYFLAMVEEGSLANASQRLFISPATLSLALRSLEADIGAELFDRTRRRLALTTPGKALVESARTILAESEGLDGLVRATQELRAGRLVVAAPADLAVDPLVRLIRQFSSAHPQVVVNVREAGDASGAADMLRAGTCEVAVCYLPVKAPGLRSIALGHHEFVLALPPGSSAPVEEKPARFEELQEVSLIAGPRGTALRALIEDAFGEVGLDAPIALEVSIHHAIPEMVLAGVGAAFLPEPVARDAERGGAVLCRTMPRLSKQYGFVHREGDLSPAGKSFVERGLPPIEQ